MSGGVPGRLIWAIGVTLAACGIVWLAYDQIRLLRGTWFWDLRWLVLGTGAIAVLSLAEWLAGLGRGDDGR